MKTPIFDQHQRDLRRNRAERLRGDRFLHQRAFDDCLDRLDHIRGNFAAALIVGSRISGWEATLRALLPGAAVTVADEQQISSLAPGSFDLCLSVGELGTNNDLSTAAFTLCHLLAPGGLLLGSIVGGQSLQRLRAAMLAAERAGGSAAPRIHPYIDGPSLAALLASVGLLDALVDVDRVDVSYPSLDRLVADLRAMGCTNILVQRSRRPISRDQLVSARTVFLAGQERANERFELLHFTAWAPKD